MPLPELDPDGMTFYALGDADEPVELYLDYQDPSSGANAESRTWWRPSIRLLGGLAWHPLPDREAALELATQHGGAAAAKDHLQSLEHRVRLQLG